MSNQGPILCPYVTAEQPGLVAERAVACSDEPVYAADRQPFLEGVSMMRIVIAIAAMSILAACNPQQPEQRAAPSPPPVLATPELPECHDHTVYETIVAMVVEGVEKRVKGEVAIFEGYETLTQEERKFDRGVFVEFVSKTSVGMGFVTEQSYSPASSRLCEATFSTRLVNEKLATLKDDMRARAHGAAFFGLPVPYEMIEQVPPMEKDFAIRLQYRLQLTSDGQQLFLQFANERGLKKIINRMALDARQYMADRITAPRPPRVSRSEGAS